MLLRTVEELITLVEISQSISNTVQNDSVDILSEYGFNLRHPYSLKCFMKWAHFIVKESKVIDLDWNNIENDLKYQHLLYHKYNGDSLRKIYFNWIVDKWDMEPETWQRMEKTNPENRKLFNDEPTIIHFILRSLSWNESLKAMDLAKAVKQGAIILKLLFKYDVITGDEALIFGSFGESIYEKISSRLGDIDEYFENEYKINVVNEYFDLLWFCMNKRNTINDGIFREEAMMKIECNNNRISSRNLLSREYGTGWCHGQHFRHYFSNKTKIIQKCLFYGISPLSISIEKGSAVMDTIKDINQTCYDFDANMFKQILLNELEMKMNSNSSRIWKLWRKIHLVSPLIIFEFLDDVKHDMFNVIHQSTKWMDVSDILMKEIIKITIEYLYVGHKFDFYDKTIYYKHEMDINVYLLMGWIGQFPMIEGSKFDQVFNEKYNNKQFAKYLFDNYADTIISAFILQKDSNLEYLHKLMMLQIPELKHCYYLLFAIVDQRGFRIEKDNDNEDQFQWIPKFLKLFESTYSDTFDINYAWNDTNGEYPIPIQAGQNTNHHRNSRNILIYILSERFHCNRTGQGRIDAVEYILNNTDIDISVESPLKYALKRGNTKLVCDIMLKSNKYQKCPFIKLKAEIIEWMNAIKTVWKYHMEQLREFVTKLNESLSERLNDDTMNNMAVNDTIGKIKRWIENVEIGEECCNSYDF